MLTSHWTYRLDRCGWIKENTWPFDLCGKPTVVVYDGCCPDDDNPGEYPACAEHRGDSEWVYIDDDYQPSEGLPPGK